MSHSLPMTHTVLLVSNIAPPALITHAKIKTPEVQTFRFFILVTGQKRSP